MATSSMRWMTMILAGVIAAGPLWSGLAPGQGPAIDEPGAAAAEKARALTGPRAATGSVLSRAFATPVVGGAGHRTSITAEGVEYPVVVVRGTPYEMGHHAGRLTAAEIREFVPRALTGIEHELQVSREVLVEVWARTAAYSDPRVAQELAGVADGAGIELSMLQALHAVPILMPYSCSSIAVWGEATVDGHLYQSRNLDWSLEVGAHEVPVVMVYLPTEGVPHVVPTFAGMIGAHTGMNARGMVLSEMGDAGEAEAPYQVHAAHFTTFFRTMLYDADSLSRLLRIFHGHEHTKRYHYVFGDGQTELGAVKVRAHWSAPADERLRIWRDNDPTDEFAPHVLPCVVYNDEGRGAFPYLQKHYGAWDAAKVIDVANRIPIKGGNVENVVYDATALRMWVSYASGSTEAYERPYALLNLRSLDADGDGRPDLEPWLGERAEPAPAAAP
jgi:isopenicillin-N N-acyltransferase-like protein